MCVGHLHFYTLVLIEEALLRTSSLSHPFFALTLKQLFMLVEVAVFRATGLILLFYFSGDGDWCGWFSVHQQIKMNGEIPSVPITTLAGISSLTDCRFTFVCWSIILTITILIHFNFIVAVLPEMPLPSPLPLSSKSLLFHPRVAEEAQNLLSVRDETLVPQLIQSLSQTSSQHM